MIKQNFHDIEDGSLINYLGIQISIEREITDKCCLNSIIDDFLFKGL